MENFDYKNVSGLWGNAWYTGYRNYSGQGCVRMGTNKNASLRGYTLVSKPGTYIATLRYQSNDKPATLKVTCGNVSKQIVLPKTDNGKFKWSECSFDIDMNDIDGTMQIDYVSGGSAVLDCVTLNYKAELSAIAGVTTDDNLVEHVEYYDLRGIRLSAPQNGVNIRKSYLRNGKITTEKFYK